MLQQVGHLRKGDYLNVMLKMCGSLKHILVSPENILIIGVNIVLYFIRLPTANGLSDLKKNFTSFMHVAKTSEVQCTCMKILTEPATLETCQKISDSI